MVPCWVQQAPPPTFTLDQAIARSLERSGNAKIADRNARADLKRGQQATASLQPQLSATAQALRFDQATRIAFNPNTPPLTALPEHTETLGLTLTQRLDLFGQIRAAGSQAQLQSAADTLLREGFLRQRRLTTANAYFGLLKAQDQVVVAQATRTATALQQQQAQTLFDGGIGQKVDLLRANTALAQADQALEAARNGEVIARATLNDLVGLPLESPVQLAPVTAPPPLPAEAVLAQAEKRDDILAAEAQIRAAELGVTLAQRSDRPSVALVLSGNYYPTPSFQYPRQRTAALGVSVSIPLANGGVTRAQTDEARLRTENARTQRDMLLNGARLEARQAFWQLKTALTQVTMTKVALEQARAARDLAQVRYREQVGLYLELSDAQTALTRAELAAVDALYDYFLARARFESAIGETTHG